MNSDKKKAPHRSKSDAFKLDLNGRRLRHTQSVIKQVFQDMKEIVLFFATDKDFQGAIMVVSIIIFCSFALFILPQTHSISDAGATALKTPAISFQEGIE